MSQPVEIPPLPEGIQMRCLMDIARRQLAAQAQREWARERQTNR